MAIAVDVAESLAAKFSALLPHLDERQKRLYLASEARSLGHGGIAAVARAAGVSRQTVAGGVDELESGQAPLGRVRRAGGGRKRLTDTDPGLRDALLLARAGEYTYEEIGAMLQAPVGTIKWRVSEARRVVKQRLRARGYGDVG